MNPKLLNVQLRFAPDHIVEVGKLSSTNGQTVFQFSADFLAASLPLSPLRLPLVPSLQAYDYSGGMQTFGVFEDSLPDGWGRKMIDRHFRKQYGRMPTILERLASVGLDGSGALSYQPEYEFDASMQFFDLAEIAKNAWDFDDDKIEDVLPQLRRAAGSSGGARPKVLIGLNEATNEVVANAPILPNGFTHWIVKFNTRSDGASSGAVEFAYNEMARAAGTDVPPCRLIETSAGAFFATKRFDRLSGGRRLHLHSAAGLLHSNFRIPGEEYETLFKLTDAITRNHQDKIELFRRTCLNVLANNRDDHLKNFAFLMDSGGNWRLSPLYDFTYNQGPNGWHTLSIAGEGQNPGIPDLRRLASNIGLDTKTSHEILEQVQTAIADYNQAKAERNSRLKLSVSAAAGSRRQGQP